MGPLDDPFNDAMKAKGYVCDNTKDKVEQEILHGLPPPRGLPRSDAGVGVRQRHGALGALGPRPERGDAAPLRLLRPTAARAATTSPKSGLQDAYCQDANVGCEDTKKNCGLCYDGGKRALDDGDRAAVFSDAAGVHDAQKGPCNCWARPRASPRSGALFPSPHCPFRLRPADYRTSQTRTRAPPPAARAPPNRRRSLAVPHKQAASARGRLSSATLTRTRDLAASALSTSSRALLGQP